MMTEMLDERATCTTDATRFTGHGIGDVQCQRQISSIFTSIVSLSARADSLLLYASSGAETEAMGDFFFFLPLEVATNLHRGSRVGGGGDGVGYDLTRVSWKTPSSSSSVMGSVDGSNCCRSGRCCYCCCKCCCVCLRIRMNGVDGVAIFCNMPMHFRAGEGGGGVVTFR